MKNIVGKKDMKMAKKQTEKDRFIQIAAGGKKMTGEVKRMAEIPPLPINRNRLQPKNMQLGITMSAFNEENAYQSFLEEKAALRAYYVPYLENYARKVADNSIGIVDFSYRKETE